MIVAKRAVSVSKTTAEYVSAHTSPPFSLFNETYRPEILKENESNVFLTHCIF